MGTGTGALLSSPTSSPQQVWTSYSFSRPQQEPLGSSHCCLTLLPILDDALCIPSHLCAPTLGHICLPMTPDLSLGRQLSLIPDSSFSSNCYHALHVSPAPQTGTISSLHLENMSHHRRPAAVIGRDWSPPTQVPIGQPPREQSHRVHPASPRRPRQGTLGQPHLGAQTPWSRGPSRAGNL